MGRDKIPPSPPPTRGNPVKANVKDELDLLPTDKNQRFFQIAIIILGVCGQACLNYPK